MASEGLTREQVEKIVDRIEHQMDKFGHRAGDNLKSVGEVTACAGIIAGLSLARSIINDCIPHPGPAGKE